MDVSSSTTNSLIVTVSFNTYSHPTQLSPRVPTQLRFHHMLLPALGIVGGEQDLPGVPTVE